MHPKVLEPESWDVVKSLSRHGIIDGWVLVGGTALALQLGHRRSDDLDFFTIGSFETDLLLERLAGIGKVFVHDRGHRTLHTTLESVRVSFLAAQAPFLFPGTTYRGLTIADPRDIAVMKLVAVGGRGSRKDFVDLYFYLRSGGDLAQAMIWLENRFKSIDYNSYHILKSLTWFEDAEQEPMPRMIKDVSWTQIKNGIIREACRLSP
jgi:hypothetical protein